MESKRRLPKWMKMQRASGYEYAKVKHLVENNCLHTICTSGNCPNIGECWNAGTATFMILGDVCTRSCKFCNTKTGRPAPPDREEPLRLANAIKLLELKHCVITSVDRDDLPDGGASFWAETIHTIKKVCPSVTIEVLIPDFDGKQSYIQEVIDAAPDVVSHNMETVRRLTPIVRSRAKYDRSLSVIKYIADNGVRTKSGLMLGLGETEDEILETMDDLRAAGCQVLTIGQYLKPSPSHMDVVDYVTPDKFIEYKNVALSKGFSFVESGPLVRSSFHAERCVLPEKYDVSFIDLGLKDYKDTWDLQEKVFNGMTEQKAASDGNMRQDVHGTLFFVEHPNVFTLGRHGKEANMLVNTDMLKQKGISFYKIDRGGDITYHGPGQIVGYPVFDLEKLGIGIKDYIYKLEESIILTLADLGLAGARLKGATGVWLDPGIAGKERKICAIGVRASRYVTMHGFAFNVNTDLSYFNMINPCGFVDKGVTSLEKELGQVQDMVKIKAVLKKNIGKVYNLNFIS